MTDTTEKPDVQASTCCELLLSKHIEAVTKAILFEDCGHALNWRDNVNLGKAAIHAYRPAANAWRNDAIRAAAEIADRYGQTDVAADIRAMIAQ